MSNDENHSYLGNPNLKPIDYQINYTLDQVKEILKCSSDPIYFIEHYCYIVSLDRGLVLFKLYDCQKEKIETILNNRKILLMESRQSGKTITSAACILWYTLFQSSKTVAILANKANSAREVLYRYQIMYENLPFWMQQGVKTWNKGDIELENGSRIITAATSASAIRGKSCVTKCTKVCIENDGKIYYTEIDNIIDPLNTNDNQNIFVLYETTNKITNEKFIGVHLTNEVPIEFVSSSSCFEDGFIGNSDLIKSSIEQFGPENFSQTIIDFFINDNYQNILKSEEHIKILSSSGFKKFKGFISQGISSELYLIRFKSNKTIKVTHDHQLLKSDGQWIQIKNLTPNTILFYNEEVISITRIENEEVYDALEVEDVHNYYTNGVISHNCNFLYVDEAAIIPNTVADEFFTSVYPTISSGETTKILLTSTPMGYNHFWKFWNEAQQGRNGFIPIFIPYDRIPGRDDKWAAEQKAMLGELKFNQEILCQFLGSSNTLISPNTISKMSAGQYIHSKDGLDILEGPIRTTKNSEGIIVNKGHVYFIIADTSRGVGGDYSAFTVIDITEYPYRVVAKYRDNKINPLLYPTVIAKVGNDYNKAYVLIEINDNGQQIANTLYMDLEYENVLAVGYDGKSGQFLSAGFKSNTILGVRTTKQVKRLGCQLLKGLVEGQKLLIQDSDIISELSTFVEQRGTFAADLGYHDDLVMTLVLFAWATNELYFKDMMNNNLRTDLYENQIREIEEDLTPFGFRNDGMEDIPPELDDSGGDIWFHKDLNLEMEKLKNKWFEKV